MEGLRIFKDILEQRPDFRFELAERGTDIFGSFFAHNSAAISKAYALPSSAGMALQKAVLLYVARKNSCQVLSVFILSFKINVKSALKLCKILLQIP